MSTAEIFMIKGIISEMPESDQQKVKEASEKLEALHAEYGDMIYGMSVTLTSFKLVERLENA